jgi:cysteinyl-tRNA synthetase
MALEYLGAEFDLHSGGIDLMFPHHENEIAQSCCATGGHFARHWMHVVHLMVDGGKMAKSLGNFYTLDDLKHRGYTAAEVRYVLLSGHYHQPLNFTLHSLDAARAALQKLAKFEKGLREASASGTAPAHEVLAAQGQPVAFQPAWDSLLDNLNVPGALGGVFSVLNQTKLSTLSADDAKSLWGGFPFILDALGIELPPVKEDEIVEAPADIKALAEQRWIAKQARDFASADDLRKQIDAAGWIIKDSKEGYSLVPKA